MPRTWGRRTGSIVRTWEGTCDAHRLPRKSRETGEPCALKGASTVREGAGRLEKDWPRYHLERSRKVKAQNSTSLAAYFTNWMSLSTRNGISICYPKKPSANPTSFTVSCKTALYPLGRRSKPIAANTHQCCPAPSIAAGARATMYECAPPHLKLGQQVLVLQVLLLQTLKSRPHVTY